MGGDWDNFTTFQAIKSSRTFSLSTFWTGLDMVGAIDQRKFLMHFLPTQLLPLLLFSYGFPGPSKFLASKTRSTYSRSPKLWISKEASEGPGIVSRRASSKCFFYSVTGLWAGVRGKLAWKYRTQTIDNIEPREAWKHDVTTSGMYSMQGQQEVGATLCEPEPWWHATLPHLHGCMVSLLEEDVVGHLYRCGHVAMQNVGILLYVSLDQSVYSHIVETEEG